VISNVHELEYDEEWDPAEAFPENLEAFAVPEILDATLPAHQVTGYRWLRFLCHEGLGALLADDMGLGKTVQAISLFAHLKETKGIRPSLVVAPKSLLDHWEEEIRRFCPGIQRIHQHGGPGRTKDAGFLSQQDVVLTTYETLRRDQLDLGQVEWKVLVCDEVQKVKNPTAQVTASVKGLKAAHRVALSGTPVENGLSELWCIVDFVQPGRLGSQREFDGEIGSQPAA
jgi:SNF2 family DNA or RNA helicase